MKAIDRGYILLKAIYLYFKVNLKNVRLIKFVCVGGSGLVVNMGLLYLLTEKLSVPYKVSSIIAIETSILSNFFLNNFWTWQERRGSAFFQRMLRYHISVLISAFLINWIFLVLFTEWFGLYYLVSNFIGIALGTLANFILNDKWTFKESPDSGKAI